MNWNVCFGLGDDAPWFAPEIPALMISTAYPFHLFDAPMVKTYINTYSGNPEFIQAAMDKDYGTLGIYRGKSGGSFVWEKLYLR